MISRAFLEGDVACNVPLLIGVPAAGKTSTIRAMSEITGWEIFASDPFFRECRALSPCSEDPRAEVVRRFLARAGRKFPDKYDALCVDAETTDRDGRSKLADGKYFRRYGEETFRAFEIEMLAWAHEGGLFASKLPDLSASAALYSENRTLLSPTNGYVAVLLDASDEAVAQHLQRDFEAVERARIEGKADATIRGAFEILFDEALAQLHPTADRRRVLADHALRATRREKEHRLPAYLEFATHVVTMTPDKSPHDCAVEILELLSSSKRGDI